MKFDWKHLQAGVALALLVLAGFIVIAPLWSAFAAAFERHSELRAQETRVRMLEERLEADRRAFATELSGAGLVIAHLLSGGAASENPPEAACARLTEALAAQGASVASPCSLAQAPLAQSYVLHTADVTARGDAAALLMSADEAGLGDATVENFRLAIEDRELKSAAGALHVRFVQIAVAPEGEEE